MKQEIFTYLKRKCLTDIRMVNRLFVSAYLRHHGLVPQVNSLLVDAYIIEESQDNALLKELICQLDKNECGYSLEDLTKLFEFVISPEDRKVTGAVYTPDYIRKRIIMEVLTNYDNNLENIHIADIACGCGGFFLTAAMFLHSQTARSFEAIIRENIYGVDMLINTGVAGGLYKDINVGDIVISSDALQHDFDVTGLGYKKSVIPGMETSVFTADTELVEMAKEACEIVNPEIQCFVGRVVTGDQFISDNGTKAALVKDYDGYCAEMEGASMAQVATLNKIPFVIIRAISDKADDSAPVAYETFEEQAIVHTVKLLAAMFLKMSK